MKILGIQNGQDAGVCLMADGVIVEAVNEERLTREKLYRGFPHQSVQHVLENNGLGFSDIDCIAYGWYGKQNDYPEFTQRFADRLIGAMERNAASGDILRRRLKAEISNSEHTRNNFEDTLRELGVDSKKIMFLDHHQCHAWSAFACSPFEEALVFTFDGRGDLRSTTVANASAKNGLTELDYLLTAESLGYLYGQITHFLGYTPHRHEGKITGLAAHGDSDKTIEMFRDLISWDGERFTANIGPYEPFYDQLNPVLSEAYGKHTPEDLAAGVQRHCEDLITQYVAHWLSKAGPDLPRDVCLAGGVAANVRINQKIAELPGIRNLYVFPHMGDGGLAVGAATHGNFRLTGNAKVAMPSVYLGPSYDDQKIASCLQEHVGTVEFEKFVDKAEQVAQALIDNKVVGFFDGRMELGPRALGARSILHHARDAAANDWLNKRMHRTEFMPFAPVTPIELASNCYIGWHEDELCSRFMTRTFDCTPDFTQTHPAVVHIDGTARPQIVNEVTNGDYYRVVKRYCDLTGDSALINTSFNRHEEPIVCTPEDAIAALEADMIDVLSIGSYIARRRPPAESTP